VAASRLAGKNRSGAHKYRLSVEGKRRGRKLELLEGEQKKGNTFSFGRLEGTGVRRESRILYPKEQAIAREQNSPVRVLEEEAKKNLCRGVGIPARSGKERPSGIGNFKRAMGEGSLGANEGQLVKVEPMKKSRKQELKWISATIGEEGEPGQLQGAPYGKSSLSEKRGIFTVQKKTDLRGEGAPETLKGREEKGFKLTVNGRAPGCRAPGVRGARGMPT